MRRKYRASPKVLKMLNSCPAQWDAPSGGVPQSLEEVFSVCISVRRVRKSLNFDEGWVRNLTILSQNPLAFWYFLIGTFSECPIQIELYQNRMQPAFPVKIIFFFNYVLFLRLQNKKKCRRIFEVFLLRIFLRILSSSIRFWLVEHFYINTQCNKFVYEQIELGLQSQGTGFLKDFRSISPPWYFFYESIFSGKVAVESENECIVWTG